MSYARKTLAVATSTLLAALLTAPATLANDSLTRSFPFRPGERLQIHSDMGHIELRHATTNELTVTVTVEKGKISDYLQIAFNDTPGGVDVEGKKIAGFASGFLSGWFSDSPELKFTVDAPEKLDLDLKTGGGHITLPSLEGEVALRTSGGHITFADLKGHIGAETSGGHITGGVISDGGTLDTSGGHISIGGAGRDLKVSTSGGHITIGTVVGHLSAETSGGHIQVEKVDGAMELDTSGGHVKAHGCTGDALVSTSGGDVILENMGGHVSAHSSGGDVTVSLSHGNAAGADLSTSGGGVTLKVPSGIGFNVDARAEGGQVEALLPSVTVQGPISKNRLEGTIGGGGNMLRLRSSHGDIRITGSAGD